MNNFLFNLKDFRLNKLKNHAGEPFTQEDLANMIGIPQHQISRWENNPESLNLANFLKICSALGMTPDQVLSYDFTLSQPSPLDVGSPYEERDNRLDLLRRYSRPFLNRQEKSSASVTECENLTTEVENLLVDISYKPFVAIVGMCDSGKTRLTQILTGIDKLVTSWTPTTSIVVVFIHKDNKPDFIKHDVTVFRGDDKHLNIGFDFRNYLVEEEYDEWRADSGDLALLAEYGTHQGSKNRHKMVRSAIVFADSPILKACNLVDFPGYGSAIGEKDNQIFLSAISIADFFIFLSSANSFMNEQDLIQLIYILKHCTGIKISDSASAFNNILIVASQAHIVGDSNQLKKILDHQSELIYKQMPRYMLKKYRQLGYDVSLTNFRNRFVTYSVDNEHFRLEFEQNLKKSLQAEFSDYVISQQEKQILEFIEKSKTSLEENIRKYQTLADHIAKWKTQFDKASEARNDFRAKFEAGREDLHDFITDIRQASKESFNMWWQTNISAKSIEQLLIKNIYDKKRATKYLISDIFENALEDLSQKEAGMTVDFQNKLNKVLEACKQFTDFFSVIIGDQKITLPFDLTGELSRAFNSEQSTINIPYDEDHLVTFFESLFRRAGAGIGVASISLKFLSRTALIAGLSSIVSGTIVVVSFSILASMGIIALLGKTWQLRLAKAVVKKLTNEGYYDRFQQQINDYWDNMRTYIDDSLTKLYESINKQIEDLKNLVSSNDKYPIKPTIEKLSECRDFFGGFPWEPISRN